MRLAVELCNVLGRNKYMDLRPAWTLPLNLHSMRLAARLGRSAEYANGLIGLAVAAALLRLRRRSDRYHRRAAAIAAEVNDPAASANVAYVGAVIGSFIRGGPRDELVRVADESRRWIDPDDYLNVVGMRCIEFAARGHTGPARVLYRRGLTWVRDGEAPATYPVAGFVLDAMLSRPADAAEILTRHCRDEFGSGLRLNYILAATACMV